MNNNNQIDNTHNRNRTQESINRQLKEFLEKGGRIEILSSPFEKQQDPKCRFGENIGFFS